MKIGKAIKTALKATKTTQTQLCSRIGVKSQSTIASRLMDDDNLGTTRVVEMLDAIGYELVIQPRKPGRRPEGQIVITAENDITSEKTAKK